MSLLIVANFDALKIVLSAKDWIQGIFPINISSEYSLIIVKG